MLPQFPTTILAATVSQLRYDSGKKRYSAEVELRLRDTGGRHSDYTVAVEIPARSTLHDTKLARTLGRAAARQWRCIEFAERFETGGFERSLAEHQTSH